jgi:hypothetical protein
MTLAAISARHYDYEHYYYHYHPINNHLYAGYLHVYT